MVRTHMTFLYRLADPLQRTPAAQALHFSPLSLPDTPAVIHVHFPSTLRTMGAAPRDLVRLTNSSIAPPAMH